MVSRASGYYGTAFQGVRGVTQGDPLSPTIFNVVVDAVVNCLVPRSEPDSYRVGDVEGSGGDFKSPAHSLHHLP